MDAIAFAIPSTIYQLLRRGDGPRHVTARLLAHGLGAGTALGCRGGRGRVQDVSRRVHEDEIEVHILRLRGRAALHQDGRVRHAPPAAALYRLVRRVRVRQDVVRVGEVHHRLRVHADDFPRLRHLHLEHPARVHHRVRHRQRLARLSAELAPRPVHLVVPFVRQPRGNLPRALARHRRQLARAPLLADAEVVVVTRRDGHHRLVPHALRDGDGVHELNRVARVPHRHRRLATYRAARPLRGLHKVLDNLQPVVIHAPSRVGDELEVPRLSAQSVRTEVGGEGQQQVVEVPLHAAGHHHALGHAAAGEDEAQCGFQRGEVRCHGGGVGSLAVIFLIEVALVAHDGGHVDARLLREGHLADF